MRFTTAETKVMLTKVQRPAILVLVMDPKQNASVSSTSAATMAEKRDEKRLHLAVPVKVFPDVASFESHNCCTYEISTNGARLVAPPGIKSVGQTIWQLRREILDEYRNPLGLLYSVYRGADVQLPRPLPGSS